LTKKSAFAPKKHPKRKNQSKFLQKRELTRVAFFSTSTYPSNIIDWPVIKSGKDPRGQNSEKPVVPCGDDPLRGP
jgi:hypothetical protein